MIRATFANRENKIKADKIRRTVLWKEFYCRLTCILFSTADCIHDFRLDDILFFLFVGYWIANWRNVRCLIVRNIRRSLKIFYSKYCTFSVRNSQFFSLFHHKWLLFTLYIVQMKNDNWITKHCLHRIPFRVQCECCLFLSVCCFILVVNDNKTIAKSAWFSVANRS